MGAPRLTVFHTRSWHLGCRLWYDVLQVITSSWSFDLTWRFPFQIHSRFPKALAFHCDSLLWLNMILIGLQRRVPCCSSWSSFLTCSLLWGVFPCHSVWDPLYWNTGLRMLISLRCSTGRRCALPGLLPNFLFLLLGCRFRIPLETRVPLRCLTGWRCTFPELLSDFLFRMLECCFLGWSSSFFFPGGTGTFTTFPMF